MFRSLITLILAGILYASSPCLAATIHVQPGDTIQSAIAVAADDDTILVADGIYTGTGNKDINFGGKRLVVRSENGPQFTFIDCESDFGVGQWRGFIFDSGEGTQSKVEGFTIQHAFGDMWGGGILCSGSSPTIANCIFDSAYSNLGGSGIGCVSGSNPVIVSCVFLYGMTDYAGGGINCIASSPLVTSCVFEGNSAPNGGAVYCEGAANPSFSECLFARNGDNYNGGAVYAVSGSHPSFANCTFYANSASAGSAVYVWQATATLDRSIVAYGSDDFSSEAVECEEESAVPTLTCCDLYGNSGGDWEGCIAGQAGIGGNFSLPPLLCDTAAGDFHLTESSPCQPDSNSCSLLIGAYPVGCGGYSGPYWYVSTTGSDTTGDGTFGNPWATIQHAVDLAADGDSVIVLDGTYQGSGNHDIDFKNRRISVASQNGADFVTIECDSARGFIFDGNEDSLSRIAGFTIRKGSAEAIWCDGTSPLIEDCVFAQNIRGITCRDSASPVIRRCVFRDNYIPDGHGGGGIGTGAAIYCTVGIDTSGVDSTRRSNPTIDSCVFEGNRATRGAAIYCYESQPSITRSLFLRNGFTDTIGVGSGIYVSDGPGPTVTQCTFYGNFGSTGAAVGVQLNGWITLDKCILAGNVVRSGGGVVFCDHAGYVNFTCSNVYGNAFGDYTGCIAGLEGGDGNISEDPIFCNAAADEFGVRGHSPCVPGHPLNTCGDFLGAYEVNCDGPVWIISPTGDDLVGDGTFAAPWGTIQHGIDQADSADTVMLTAGTFTGTGNRLASFGGKELVLTSYYGADSTAVNAENYARLLTFDHYEDSNSVVNGLTIRGASEAAIYCDSSSPSITYCTFTLNILAIDCWRDSDLKIEYCDFIDNNDLGGDRAGIGIHFASPSVYRCLFQGNRASAGGAVYVAGNTASPDITECLFIRNGYPLYQTSKGAGVQALMSAHPVVQSCTFYGNMADWGSALYVQDADISVANSIVAFNYDSYTGYAVFCLGNGDIDLLCSNVYGNQKGDYHDCIGEEEFQDGNFSANPLFCDTAGGNFQLAANSRCAPANNGCGVRIGALDTACAAQANTGTGTDVAVNAGEGVTVTFDEVTGDGNTDVVMQTGGEPPPDGFATVPSDPTTYYNISTTALYTGDIQICVSYDEADLSTSEHKLTLQHYDGVNWLDITTSIDMLANIICGVTPGLSPFILAQDTMPNTAPGLFSRLLPADSAVVARDSVVLAWSGCIDPDGDFVTYDLALSVAGIDTAFTVSDTTLTLDLTGWGLPSGQEDVTWSVYAEDGIDSTAAANGSGMFVVDVTVGVDDGDPAILPSTYALAQNYPNPFNPQTEIRFALPAPASVELVIFNMLGQQVRTLVRGHLPAGYHVVGWNGRDLSGLPAGSGVYFYRLTAGNYVATKKMLLLK